MSYHTSIYLFVFLPLVVCFYQFTPKKYRWMTLLIASYIFFWTISGRLLIYLIGTTCWVYGICHYLIRIKDGSKQKKSMVLFIGIAGLLGVLGYLKYYNFFAQNANNLLDIFGCSVSFNQKNLVLPIGISFYTLEAIGVMVDVYWNKIKIEKNPCKLALFFAFFPKIMEGPIQSYAWTMDQLWAGNSLTEENLSKGSVRIFWGLFKKMIIADRLFILVQAIFEHYEKYHGMMVIIGAIAYTVQLYMEFSGCMDMIIGSGKLFGVDLQENFQQPFASKSAAEFWRRWHMSLGIWFKTYIFYPMSLTNIVKKWNKYGRKHYGKYITKLGVSAMCLFPVWLCNGLWHGPQWNYIFYGMYYFTILLMEIAVEPVRDFICTRCRLNPHAVYYQCFQIIKTWIIIFCGELFFRANGLRVGLSMFKSIFYKLDLHVLWDGTLLNFGLDSADYVAIVGGCMIVGIVGIIKERKLLGDTGLQRLHLPVRWAIYYGLIFAVIIFGAYGVGYQEVDMIYAGF